MTTIHKQQQQQHSPRRYYSIQRLIQNNPMESMALIAISPFAITFMKNIYRSISGGRTTEQEQQQQVQLEEVKLRGKTFLSTASKQEINLGWSGAFPYYVPVLLLAIEAFGMARHGEEHFLRKGFTPAQRGKFQLWLFFGLLPLADMVIGADWLNPSTKQTNERRLAWRFRLPLYMWVATAIVLNLFGYRIALKKDSNLTTLSKLAIFGNMALLNGVFGINISHELIHKQSTLEKFLGNLLLVFVNYVHFGSEHLSGHHEHVATPKDPATARKGENVYQFIPRTVIGSFLSACEIERERLHGQWWRVDNRILQGVLAPFLWSLILYKFSGSKRAIPIFYASGLISASLLEVVNYMEHYGLERRLESTSDNVEKYEVVDPRHSWNSPLWLSNTVLFKLQRHSDHHAFASRPYEILRNFVESPQLPTGYIGMFVLSLVPPLFFQVMDPLVKAHALEFNPEREPTPDELEQANRIKSRSKTKMWIITGCEFMLASYVVFSG
jgi:alkane 1-monooxygenase